MHSYSQHDLLSIAKRVHNTKRSYLLVNPLQAKHIPVSPAQALEMMDRLGEQLARRYPGTRLVIGFAETATAIGAAVASRISANCVYLPTTREEVPQAGEWILFTEEHSHATQQKLCGDNLAQWVEQTQSVIFVDDEISTGKTLRNMIARLREQCPGLAGKTLVAASLVNRVGPEDEARLTQAGVRCEYLLKVAGDNAAQAVESIQAEEAREAAGTEHFFFPGTLDCGPLPNPRAGIGMKAYREACQQMAEAFWNTAGPVLEGLDRVVVLGTEECMYPALILGKALEEQGLTVRCHATTRSPIGICSAPNYPITSGYKLPSFYDSERETYLYNLAPCGVLIVVSDTPRTQLEALNALAGAWESVGCQRIIYVQGGRNVWYL